MHVTGVVPPTVAELEWTSFHCGDSVSSTPTAITLHLTLTPTQGDQVS